MTLGAGSVELARGGESSGTPARPHRRGHGRAKFVEWVAIGVVILVHGFAAWDATAPVWMDDEVGYLSNAQLLAGVGDPRSLGAIGYYSGWSLLLTPLWWVFEDPGRVYRAAAVLSALSGVLLVVPLSLIARRLGLSRPWATVVAALVAIAPARSVMSGYVLSENFLTLLVAFVVHAALRFSERPSAGRAAWLGFIAAYAFFTHGRAAPVLVATALWFLVRIRRHRWASLLGGVVCIGTAAASYAINGSVISTIYDTPTDREGSAVRALLGIDLAAALTALTGLTWYELAAWAGLPLLGAAICINRMVGELRLRSPAVWTWWSVAATGVLLISVTFTASAIERGSHRVEIYAYGRYMEPIVAVLVLLALAALVRRARLVTVVSWVVAAGVLGIVFLSAIVPQVPSGARVSPINAPGLMPWSWMGVDPAATAYPWLAATLVGLLSVSLVAILRPRPVWLCLVLAVAFGLASLKAEAGSMRTFDRPWRDDPYVLAQIARTLDVEPVSYDLSDAEAVGRNGYQYWLAPESVPVFRSRTDLPPTDVVIARSSWPRGERMGAEKIADDPRFDEALWVLPGPEQDRLKALGVFQHRPLSGPLPLAAYAYELRVEGVPDETLIVDRDDPPEIRVILRHAGSAAPWPSIAKARSAGFVRVVLYWQHAGGQSPQILDLPRTVLPGEEIILDAPLSPPIDVPDGRTTIRVGLVQEGVRPFDPAGSERLTIDVDVRR